MPVFPRDEIEEMLRRWIAANDEAGRTGDWAPMAEFYTDDAVYSWNTGPENEFVARGKDQIRDWVLGTEMAGLESWTYPYVRALIDDQKGEVLGVWRQLAPEVDEAGNPLEIAGTGGSWFRYAGDFKWEWQRDFFDHHNAAVVFLELAGRDLLKPEMVERMSGKPMPGHTTRSDFDWYTTIIDPEA